MGIFLNSNFPFELYYAMASERYFVDKTLLLNELIPALATEQRFFCVTRPRRFGKSVMANMIGAFFGKAVDSCSIFCKLAIAETENYKENLTDTILSLLISVKSQRNVQHMMHILPEFWMA